MFNCRGDGQIARFWRKNPPSSFNYYKRMTSPLCILFDPPPAYNWAQKSNQTSEIAINSPLTSQSCHLILVHLMLKLKFWPKMINYPSWSISFECCRFKFEDLNHFLVECFKSLNVLENLSVRKYLIKFLIFLERIAVFLVLL